MKKLLFSAMLCACSLAGMTQAFFNVDGVRYLQKSENKVIVARQDANLSGDMTITVDYCPSGVKPKLPERLTNDSKVYVAEWKEEIYSNEK